MRVRVLHICWFQLPFKCIELLKINTQLQYDLGLSFIVSKRGVYFIGKITKNEIAEAHRLICINCRLHQMFILFLYLFIYFVGSHFESIFRLFAPFCTLAHIKYIIYVTRVVISQQQQQQQQQLKYGSKVIKEQIIPKIIRSGTQMLLTFLFSYSHTRTMHMHTQ